MEESKYRFRNAHAELNGMHHAVSASHAKTEANANQILSSLIQTPVSACVFQNAAIKAHTLSTQSVNVFQIPVVHKQNSGLTLAQLKQAQTKLASIYITPVTFEILPVNSFPLCGDSTLNPANANARLKLIACLKSTSGTLIHAHAYQKFQSFQTCNLFYADGAALLRLIPTPQ